MPFATILGHSVYITENTRGGVVLDLGACKAEFSRLMNVRFGSRCFAFEAHPGNFETIEEREGLTKFNYAVMAGDGGETVLREYDDGSRWVSSERPAEPRLTGRTYRVKTIDLCGIRALLGFERIALAKVDIEGSEFDLFLAATAEDLCAIDQYTVEFHDFMLPDKTHLVQEIKARFGKLGYSWLCFSRRTHGDVVIIRSDLLGTGAYSRFCLRKYLWGAARMAKRAIRGLAPSARKVR